jgi:hypothetical protein
MDQLYRTVRLVIIAVLTFVIMAVFNPGSNRGAFRLILFLLRPVVALYWRVVDAPPGKRLPGQLHRISSENNSSSVLISGLPTDVLESSLLSFLTNQDVVRLLSLLSDADIATLHARLKSAQLTLTNVTVSQAVKWLHARKISPKALIVADTITATSQLQLMSAIVSETEAFHLQSSAAFHITGIINLLWRFGEHLTVLDLRLFAVWDDALREIRRLKQLRVLHFQCGRDFTARCVAGTLDALPHLRDFGMHRCFHGDKFRINHATLVGSRCTNLTALTLTDLYSDTLDASDPRKASFLVNMCPHLQNLVDLDLSHGIWFMDCDARVLVQHCGNLQRLTLSQAMAKPEFVDALTTLMHKFKRLQYLDVSRMTGCDDALIVAVAKHCTELRELHMEGVGTDVCIHALAQCCPPLQLLVCTISPALTEPALEALRMSIPGLRVIAKVEPAEGEAVQAADDGTQDP